MAKDTNVGRDELLANSIAKSLNAKDKGLKVAYFLGDEMNDSPSNITD